MPQMLNYRIGNRFFHCLSVSTTVSTSRSEHSIPVILFVFNLNSIREIKLNFITEFPQRFKRIKGLKRHENNTKKHVFLIAIRICCSTPKPWFTARTDIIQTRFIRLTLFDVSLHNIKTERRIIWFGLSAITTKASTLKSKARVQQMLEIYKSETHISQ